jgi:DNA repair ATPase RecN
MSEEVEKLREMNLTIQVLENDIQAISETLSNMRKDLKTRLKEYMATSLAQLERPS